MTNPAVRRLGVTGCLRACTHKLRLFGNRWLMSAFPQNRTSTGLRWMSHANSGLRSITSSVRGEGCSGD